MKVSTDENGISKDGIAVYNQHNQLVTGLNDVKVTGPVWQYLNHISDWVATSKERCNQFKNFEEYEAWAGKNRAKVRRVYLTVPPTEPKNKEMEKLTQHVKTSLYENHVMMAKLCDLLSVSPMDIKTMATDNAPRLFEADVLSIISTYTKVPVSELTEPAIATTEGRSEKSDAQPVKEVEKDILTLQKELRDTLYVRPFDIDAIESAGIKLCDAVVDNSQFATEAGGDVEALAKQHASKWQGTQGEYMASYMSFLAGYKSRPNNLVDVEEVVKVDGWQDLEKAKLSDKDLPLLVFQMHDGEIVTNAEWEKKTIGKYKPVNCFLLPTPPTI